MERSLNWKRTGKVHSVFVRSEVLQTAESFREVFRLEGGYACLCHMIDDIMLPFFVFALLSRLRKFVHFLLYFTLLDVFPKANKCERA